MIATLPPDPAMPHAPPRFLLECDNGRRARIWKAQLASCSRVEHKAPVIASRLAGEVRLAEPSDIAVIAGFMIAAGAGLYEFLLNDIIHGLQASDILALAIAEESSAYFYGNALLATEGQAPLGLALAFPAEELSPPQEALSLISPTRLKTVEGLFQAADKGAFYLNSLAVAPDAVRHGLGRLLLETTAGLAQARGFARINLHVWTDNAPAMRLYEDLGFEVARRIEMPPSPLFTHRGPVAELEASVDPMLARLHRGD